MARANLETERVAKTLAERLTQPGKALPKYAGSINLERIDTTDEVKTLINEVYEARKIPINKRRQIPITHSETQAMAAELGWTYDDLLKIKKGQALNHAEVTAGRNLNTASVNDVRKWADGWLSSKTPEAWDRYVAALGRHMTVQEVVSGASTEAGRALQAHRIMAQPVNVAEAVMKKIGKVSPEVMDQKAARIAEVLANEPIDFGEANRLIRELTPASTADKVYEVWVNALLSWPKTHIVNVTGNTLTNLMRLPQRGVQAALDVGRVAVTGKPREVFFGEVAADGFGMMQGLTEGARLGLRAWKTEMPSQAISKLEFGGGGSIPGQLGRTVRMPGRALMAMDEFFKAVAQTGETYAQAYRQAAKEGSRTLTLPQHIASIVAAPGEAITEKAASEALYRTFQAPLGEGGAALFRAVRTVPGLRYVVPFFRTPTNIAKFSLEHTPLEFLQIARRAATGKGLGYLAESEQAAKATVGSMIGAGIFLAIKRNPGLITGGGPSDKTKKQELLSSGWRPYSFRHNGNHYSYGRLEPVGSVVGMAADLADNFERMSEGDQGSAATAIASSISKNIVSKTYLVGLSDALDALSNPDRFGEKWTYRLAGSLVPATVAGAQRLTDPLIRDPQTPIEAIKSRLPGLSQGVQPRMDVTGQLMTRDEPWWSQALVPGSVTREKIPFELVTERHRMQFSLERTRVDVQKAVLAGDKHGAREIIREHNARIHETRRRLAREGMRVPREFIKSVEISPRERENLIFRTRRQQGIISGQRPPVIKPQYRDFQKAQQGR